METNARNERRQLHRRMESRLGAALGSLPRNRFNPGLNLDEVPYPDDVIMIFSLWAGEILTGWRGTEND